MGTARSIVEAASNARQKAGRKLRWPISRIVVSPENEAAAKAVDRLRSVLMDQTNSKAIVLTGVGQSWDELGLEVIPDPGKIGPVFKKDARITSYNVCYTKLLRTTPYPLIFFSF